jgi:hypothetical protein
LGQAEKGEIHRGDQDASLGFDAIIATCWAKHHLARHAHAFSERQRDRPRTGPATRAAPGDTFVFAHHGTRIHVTRLRPFGIAMRLAGAGALGVIDLLMLLGAALVGAAAMGVIILAALLSRLFHGPARP